MYACALGDIYTFGPTFRAENSNTARHLAEFWMIEPEMAFAGLEDDMACAEAYLKHATRCGRLACLAAACRPRRCSLRACGLASRPLARLPPPRLVLRCRAAFLPNLNPTTNTNGRNQHQRHNSYILEHCEEDLAFLDSMVEKGLLQRLQDVAERPFATVTYTEAVKLLRASGHQFEYPVAWGADLQSEHERFLSETVRPFGLSARRGDGERRGVKGVSRGGVEEPGPGGTLLLLPISQKRPSHHHPRHPRRHPQTITAIKSPIKSPITTKQVFNRTPLFVTDYPRDIKAFYMRQNDDGATVAAMDLLVPK